MVDFGSNYVGCYSDNYAVHYNDGVVVVYNNMNVDDDGICNH
jgi:hypothetical protein